MRTTARSDASTRTASEASATTTIRSARPPGGLTTSAVRGGRGAVGQTLALGRVGLDRGHPPGDSGEGAQLDVGDATGGVGADVEQQTTAPGDDIGVVAPRGARTG